jgi:hypothetical protein
MQRVDRRSHEHITIQSQERLKMILQDRNEYHIDETRWTAVEGMPMPSGVGDLETGLCAAARIVYAATGAVSDLAPCVTGTIRQTLTSANDSARFRQHRHLLGTREIAERVISADYSMPCEVQRAALCAQYARRSADDACRYAAEQTPLETCAAEQRQVTLDLLDALLSVTSVAS